MLRKWVLAAILAGVLAAIGAAQGAPKFLTNDDVVSMVKAGQDADAILGALKSEGTDFVVIVQGERRQVLTVSHTQIVPTNAQASSLGGLASEPSLTTNLSSIAQSLLSNGMMKPGAGGIGSMAMLANPIFGPAMIATSLFAKHKANSANSNSVTDVWAIPGQKSDAFTHNSQPEFEVSFDGIPGITLDEYEPVLIRLQPSPQSNFRLVGATAARPNEMQSSEANWDLYSSFVEQREPTQATKVSSGRYQLQATGGLTPGSTEWCCVR